MTPSDHEPAGKLKLAAVPVASSDPPDPVPATVRMPNAGAVRIVFALIVNAIAEDVPPGVAAVTFRLPVGPDSCIVTTAVVELVTFTPLMTTPEPLTETVV